MLHPSFHEIYGKQHNAEDIQKILQKNAELEIRSYQLGDPVNTNENFPKEGTLANKEAFRVRKPKLAMLILRFVNFFFT
jgi:hypothetical protein